MAFTARILEAVYHDIQIRKAELGRLSLIEFDDAEYQILLERAQEIVRRYEQCPESKQKKARVVFLAFVFEYLRHTNYAEDDNKFWEEFEDTIGIGRNEHRNLIYAMLEQVFRPEEEDITLERKVKRLFVKTLISELKATETTREEFVDFFCWYYQHHRSSEATLETEITSDLIQKYTARMGKPLSIHLKAIPTLNKDCQTLAHIIDYATEHGLFLAHSNLDTYQEEIIKASNGKYDLNRVHLIRNRKAIYNLIIKLENHRTPAQFLRDLKSHATLVVQAPNGQRLSAVRASQQWQAETMEYGLYKLGALEYRVVPLSWLRFTMIEQWHYEQVTKLQREDYVAYKKRKSFEVRIGDRSVKGRKCIFDGTQCYIWANKVPHGEPLFIDGRLYHSSAGLDWKTSLELGFNEDGEPDMVIVFNWLKVFYPNDQGRRLIISTSQGHKETKYILDHERGVCQLHRAINFHLDRLDAPIAISIAVEQKLLQRKTIELETAYLFSALTRERIPSGTKREWGEKHYYLFAQRNKAPNAGNGIELLNREVYFGNYAIYEVKWNQKDSWFHLKVGDVSWSFEKQHYFYVQVNQLLSRGPVHLSGQQIHCFIQSQIQVRTNQQIAESGSITCCLLYQCESVEVPVSFQACGGDLYRLSEVTIKHFNFLSVDRHCYGQFELLFYEDRQLLGQTSITVIPELRITLPYDLFIERRVAPVKITSSHLKIWDPKTNQQVNSANFLISPKLLGQPWKNELQAPRGIRCFTSQAVNIPVMFPAISETVEVEVCPLVFGFRLYQRQNQRVDYQQVNQFDYYALEASAIYIHTVAHSIVAIYMNQTAVRTDHADEDGHLLIENLHFLKKYCKEEQTAISIVSEGLESTFYVCWKPLIHELIVKEYRIDLEISGPQNTGIILQLVDAGNNIHYQQRITCRAEHSKVSLDLPEIRTEWGQCYLIPYYYLADGIQLPTVWQQRLEASNINRIPMDWLRLGIGVSSEMLLQYCIAE